MPRPRVEPDGRGQFHRERHDDDLAGLVNVSGTNRFDSGTANLTGNYLCTNNTLVISGGTANFNGTGTVAPAVVNMDGGTLERQPAGDRAEPDGLDGRGDERDRSDAHPAAAPRSPSPTRSP